MRKENRGFSLMELMIVVAIIGILVSVAYPAYQEHVRKGNRAAAQGFLLNIERIEEQTLFDARSYRGDLITSGDVPVPTDVSKFYDVVIATRVGPPPGYTVTATPVAGTMQASDGILTLDSNGTRTHGGNPW